MRLFLADVLFYFPASGTGPMLFIKHTSPQCEYNNSSVRPGGVGWVSIFSE